MVILTRRVLLSLSAGIVAAALLLADFRLAKAASIIWGNLSGNVFTITGGVLEWSMWNLYIIFFLLILGVITAFITVSGGSRAFGEWAVTRVKSRTGAQVMAALLGVLIFIDDYFNALAVGQVSRPITDRHRISRAKLAYIIDSTSAPVCVVAPVSSWGAYIIGLIGTILATHEITGLTAFSAFMQIIPMNYYVWAALGMVFIVAVLNKDFGAMEKYEQHAIQTGNVVFSNREIPGELKEDLPVSSHGTVGGLIWPIVALIIGTIASMFYTGQQAAGANAGIMAIFENTDVAKSLFWGGLIGLAAALVVFSRQASAFSEETGTVFNKGIKEGIKSMLPAIYILFLAWTIVSLIGELGTGTYLASLVEKANLPISLLPVLLFIIAGVMAFATGTSWGSFGILLPIAGEIAAATDITLLLPALAAVLAGAVFGDHCSPISDTTILSSTGAGSNHMDHVVTQIPYALAAALMAAAGYLVLGFTGSVVAGLMMTIVLLVIFSLGLKKKKPGTV